MENFNYFFFLIRPFTTVVFFLSISAKLKPSKESFDLHRSEKERERAEKLKKSPFNWGQGRNRKGYFFKHLNSHQRIKNELLLWQPWPVKALFDSNFCQIFLTSKTLSMDLMLPFWQTSKINPIKPKTSWEKVKISCDEINFYQGNDQPQPLTFPSLSLSLSCYWLILEAFYFDLLYRFGK